MNATILNPGWTTDGLRGGKFPTILPKDEFLHPVPADATYAWTETSYWGCPPSSRLRQTRVLH